MHILQKSKHNQGFSLIETLVAISIISASIVGPLGLASKSLSQATLVKDQIFLASKLEELVYFFFFKKLVPLKLLSGNLKRVITQNFSQIHFQNPLKLIEDIFF